ncbi:hypothetical protein XENOCAPTIV_023278, partial [Xenoophorus captivus]
ECQNRHQSLAAFLPCSSAQEAATAPASMDASVISTLTESSKTWGPGRIQALQVQGICGATDNGWETGWSQDASHAREVPASKATVTQRVTKVSPVPAIPDGQGLCVTSKLAIPVMAIS